MLYFQEIFMIDIYYWYKEILKTFMLAFLLLLFRSFFSLLNKLHPILNVSYLYHWKIPIHKQKKSNSQQLCYHIFSHIPVKKWWYIMELYLTFNARFSETCDDLFQILMRRKTTNKHVSISDYIQHFSHYYSQWSYNSH